MTRFLIDTNALLRYLLKDIPAQSEIVAKIFHQAKKSEVQITIPLIVFFEATYMLTRFYKISRSDVQEQCERLLMVMYLDIPDRQVLLLGYQTWVENRSISFADAVLMHMATLADQELLTFDKKLAKLAKTSKI